MDLAPAYLAPPVGIRHKITTDEGFTRRNPRDGPYGVFISYVSEGVHRAIDTGPYEYLWKQAAVFIMTLLWESNDQRKWAKEQLISINIAIDEKNEKNLSQPPGTGCIEVHNLHRAGLQLDLAVRDVIIYRSTARYEDVRDFVWERIQNRNYPHSWTVTRQQFKAHLAKFKRKDTISSDLDTEDGAYEQKNVQATGRPTRINKPNRKATLADVVRAHKKAAATQTPRPPRITPRVPLSRKIPRKKNPAYPESETMKNRSIIR